MSEEPAEKLQVKDTRALTDNRERDTEEMAKEMENIRKELTVTNNTLNVTLMILSGLQLQPFLTKRYLSNREIDHVNFLLTSLMGPIARTLNFGRMDNDTYRLVLSRICIMCLNYFVNRAGITTQGSQIKMEEATYSIREENGLPYAMQDEPDLPKTKYHDQPLEMLLDEVERRGNTEIREHEETIKIDPDSTVKDAPQPESAS